MFINSPTHQYNYFFFFNDTAPTEIYPLPLHAALPIFPAAADTLTITDKQYRTAARVFINPRGTYNVINELNIDRKSTRLNSSHLVISYAVFCLKKKQNCLNSRPSYSHSPIHTSRGLRV